MEAKECLNRILALWQEIAIKREQISAMDTVATGMTVSSDVERVSGSKNQQVMEMAAIKLIDYENEMQTLTDELFALLERVRPALNCLGYNNMNMVLSKRYFQYENWDAIAEEMHLTARRVRQIHQQAVNEFTLQYRLLYSDPGEAARGVDICA